MRHGIVLAAQGLLLGANLAILWTVRDAGAIAVSAYALGILVYAGLVADGAYRLVRPSPA